MLSLPVTRAILSVTDKTDLVSFASFLADSGVRIVSTGGTRKLLSDSGIQVTGVSRITGFPEILGGRVKTLHPAIHAGILADKDDASHLDTLEELSLAPFDLVCVNLYDFAGAAGQGLDLGRAVEAVDIGGPTLLRAAAKNFYSVLVVPDPSHYARVRSEMEAGQGRVGLDLRRELAAETFARVSAYDQMISDYLRTREA